MSREWRLYLVDMQRFCNLIIEYHGARDRQTLESDSLRYDAILRNVELIGEAARNLPDEVRSRAPDVPWRAIVRVRNILAHMYFGVDRDAVWDIIAHEVPALLTALKKLQDQIDA